MSQGCDQNRALVERVKELNCLYSISKLTDKRDLGLEDVLETTVRIVPAAWQYPEVAAARLQVHDKAFRSEKYRSSPWKMAAPIIVRGVSVGALEVCYLEERPESDEGPFLQEERSLINVIAQRLGEIIERKAAEEQLLTYQQQLRCLALQTTRTEERERRRIACELHDRIGQSLALAAVHLAQLLENCPGEEKRNELSALRTIIGQAIEDTRTLIFEISPPVLHEFGLVTALEWLVEQAHQRYGLQVAFIQQADPGQLGDELSTTLFQAARELLANVGRHARTRQATLTLGRTADEVKITVVDSGVGFDVQEARRKMLQDGSFGLFSIGERLEQLGGRLVLDSAPGQGTRATVAVPAASGPPGRGDEPRRQRQRRASKAKRKATR